LARLEHLRGKLDDNFFSPWRTELREAPLAERVNTLPDRFPGLVHGPLRNVGDMRRLHRKEIAEGSPGPGNIPIRNWSEIKVAPCQLVRGEGCGTVCVVVQLGSTSSGACREVLGHCPGTGRSGLTALATALEDEWFALQSNDLMQPRPRTSWHGRNLISDQFPDWDISPPGEPSGISLR